MLFTIAVLLAIFVLPSPWGLVAIVVYEWVGLAFLRRGWINLDLVWTAALLAAGLLLLLV